MSAILIFIIVFFFCVAMVLKPSESKLKQINRKLKKVDIEELKLLKTLIDNELNERL